MKHTTNNDFKNTITTHTHTMKNMKRAHTPQAYNTHIKRCVYAIIANHTGGNMLCNMYCVKKMGAKTMGREKHNTILKTRERIDKQHQKAQTKVPDP